MREPLFVKQNIKKWEDFENVPTSNPDELANRFIQITDDLAYAKTFYPKSKTTEYLNGLAATLHQSIYKNKTEKGNRFITFWKYELPLLFKEYQKQLLYSFIFFSVFTLMGILGDHYVDETNANIAKGDPFGIYKEQGEFSMFLDIASHNIYVALLNFVVGIVFSVGTVFMLFENSVMLGAFEGFFFSKGLGAQSILVIFIHGTLEMSSFVIASAAGLVLPNPPPPPQPPTPPPPPPPAAHPRTN